LTTHVPKDWGAEMCFPVDSIKTVEMVAGFRPGKSGMLGTSTRDCATGGRGEVRSRQNDAESLCTISKKCNVLGGRDDWTNRASPGQIAPDAWGDLGGSIAFLHSTCTPCKVCSAYGNTETFWGGPSVEGCFKRGFEPCSATTAESSHAGWRISKA